MTNDIFDIVNVGLGVTETTANRSDRGAEAVNFNRGTVAGDKSSREWRDGNPRARRVKMEGERDRVERRLRSSDKHSGNNGHGKKNPARRARELRQEKYNDPRKEE